MDAIYLAIGKLVVFAVGVFGIWIALGAVGLAYYNWSVTRAIRKHVREGRL